MSDITVTLPPDLVEEIVAEVTQHVLAALDARADHEPPEWMSVERAAEHMGCSPERLRKLIARRRIAYHQESPRARIFLHRDDLDAFLSKTRHEPRSGGER